VNFFPLFAFFSHFFGLLLVDPQPHANWRTNGKWAFWRWKRKKKKNEKEKKKKTLKKKKKKIILSITKGIHFHFEMLLEIGEKAIQ